MKQHNKTQIMYFRKKRAMPLFKKSRHKTEELKEQLLN